MDQPIRVLHVDGDPEFVDAAATFLEREDDRIAVRTATSPHDALEMLGEAPIDCIVSGYEIPDMDGIELLEAVREERSELPFVLYTGRGPRRSRARRSPRTSRTTYRSRTAASSTRW